MKIKEEDIEAFIGGMELAKDRGLGHEITEEEWGLYVELTERRGKDSSDGYIWPDAAGSRIGDKPISGIKGGGHAGA